MGTAEAQASAAGQADGEPRAVIHTEDLTKVYPGTDFAAVDRLNLDVRAGEIFGLLGPNGAGKTTTAGMLTTRVVPTSGRALLAGVDVAAHPALAKQLSGIVSQQNTLDRQLTVWENLYFHGREIGALIDLGQVLGVDDRARLAFCRALCCGLQCAHRPSSLGCGVRFRPGQPGFAPRRGARGARAPHGASRSGR